MKPTICIDFDGVIHSYEHGWRNGEIYGTVTLGFFPWVMKMKDRFTLVIYSSRSKDIDMRGAMYRWLQEQLSAWQYVMRSTNEEATIHIDDFTFAHEKPSAFMSIDDRCICFDGDWSKITAESIFNFKPWNK